MHILGIFKDEICVGLMRNVGVIVLIHNDDISKIVNEFIGKTLHPKCIDYKHEPIYFSYDLLNHVNNFPLLWGKSLLQVVACLYDPTCLWSSRGTHMSIWA